MPFKDYLYCEGMCLGSVVLFKNNSIYAFPFYFKYMYNTSEDMICIEVHLPSSGGNCQDLCCRKYLTLTSKMKKGMGAGCQCLQVIRVV